MNISMAVQGILRDRDYLRKLAITALITAVTLALTPLLVGLAGWALLFGYQVEIMRRVRADGPRPLPRWDQPARYLAPGANVLIAFAIYNVPNILLGCGWAFIIGVSDGARIVGSTVMIASVCCLAPIMLVYNALMLPFFALGLARFAEDPRLSAFFAVGSLYEDVGQQLGVTLQYLLWLVLALAALAALLIIPLAGWALFAALLFPVTGILAGQYARRVLGPTAPPVR